LSGGINFGAIPTAVFPFPLAPWRDKMLSEVAGAVAVAVDADVDVDAGAVRTELTE